MVYEGLIKQSHTRFDGRSAEGSHGTLNPARHLLRELSRVRMRPSPAFVCPPGCARHHAVPDRRPGGPRASVSRRPYLTYLVQLVSASVVSSMHVSPDRALARPATGTAAGL